MAYKYCESVGRRGALGSVDSVYGVRGMGKAWYYSCMWFAPWTRVVNGFLW